MKKKESGRNFRLLFGLLCLGLTTWSLMSAASEPSRYCLEKIKSETASYQHKTGRNPSNLAREKMAIRCSESQVGLDLDNFFANRSQETPSQKELRCQGSARFVRENEIDTSGRSEEELTQVCLNLPSEHAAACGFPLDPEYFFVIENQKCVHKNIGITSSTVAKSGSRAPVEGGFESKTQDSDLDPEGTSAQ